MKLKKSIMSLTPTDFIDIKLKIEENEVAGFALNYRTKIENSYHEVYRVDTAHGYLHEQRYWISPEPIPIPMIDKDLNSIFNLYLDNIKENFARYKKYYVDRMKIR